jgi:hypothetical protein
MAKKYGKDGVGDDDELADIKEKFKAAMDAESDNRKNAIDDLKFARLGDQWPDAVRRQRERDARPCLTINRLPAFIRQVTNDARQNKPSIKVRPADSGADKETAEVVNGIIRNIEQSSNADVAYDTAADNAVTMGFGYFRIDIQPAFDDTFDNDLRIEPIANPLSVYRDPFSTAADSSDWNCAFVVEYMSKEKFETQYKDAEKVDWDIGDYKLDAPWREGEQILVAEYWERIEAPGKLFKLSNGQIISADQYAILKDVLDAQGVTIQAQRETKTHRVTQKIMTGAEVLETNPWAGKYIPIIAVYGDEVNVEGERIFRSLIRDAKDPQMNFNYWRTAATELVALAPKVPYIGKKGAFDHDSQKWDTANTVSHSYLEYEGDTPPARQPLGSQVPAGALQEALNASDDMKAVMGIYDASLGARSNETSGRAIMARQREGDVSTFHFIDNLSRGIRHGGRVLLDLIPKVYTPGRMVRVLGQDGAVANVKLGEQPQTNEEGIREVYALGSGKYDLVVDTGPSYTTRRQETAEQMTELLRAFPDAAPVIGDILVKNLDWQGADEIAERLKAMVPQQAQGGPSEEQQQVMAELAELKAENAKLKADAMQKDIENAGARLKADEARAELHISKVVSAAKSEMTPELPAPEPVPQQPQQQMQPINIAVPEQIGPAIADAVAQALITAFHNMPPIRVEMPPTAPPPRMRKRIVRDPRTREALYSEDEPIEETMPTMQ